MSFLISFLMCTSCFLQHFYSFRGRTEKLLKFVPGLLQMWNGFVFICFWWYRLMNIFSYLFFSSENSCWIMQANLGLLKVLVAKSHAEGLQIHLASMVEGLLKWQDDTKNQFKSKVSVLSPLSTRDFSVLVHFLWLYSLIFLHINTSIDDISSALFKWIMCFSWMAMISTERYSNCSFLSGNI